MSAFLCHILTAVRGALRAVQCGSPEQPDQVYLKSFRMKNKGRACDVDAQRHEVTADADDAAVEDPLGDAVCSRAL